MGISIGIDVLKNTPASCCSFKSSNLNKCISGEIAKSLTLTLYFSQIVRIANNNSSDSFKPKETKFS